MPTFADSRLPKPHSWDEFEKIARSVAKIRWKSGDFTRHGRQGQAQSGVDVYGQDENGAWIGIQCKNTIGGVSESTVRAEVTNAEGFVPTLSKLFIATTADADVDIQGFVRVFSSERRAAGKFEVGVLYWEDLWDDLTLDETRLFQHFPQLRPTISTAVAGPSHDQRLFEKFQNELPFEPAIRLLREHDFNGSFELASTKPLRRFVDLWDSPEYEFLDDELRDALGSFYSEASKMASCIAIRTAPVGAGDMASVYSDNARARGPRSEHVIREAREINEAASAFVPRYEAFVRLCKAKLMK